MKNLKQHNRTSVTTRKFKDCSYLKHSCPLGKNPQWHWLSSFYGHQKVLKMLWIVWRNSRDSPWGRASPTRWHYHGKVTLLSHLEQGLQALSIFAKTESCHQDRDTLTGKLWPIMRNSKLEGGVFPKAPFLPVPWPPPHSYFKSVVCEIQHLAGKSCTDWQFFFSSS